LSTNLIRLKPSLEFFTNVIQKQTNKSVTSPTPPRFSDSLVGYLFCSKCWAAMGDSSKLILSRPSFGRVSLGLTSSAEHCADTWVSPSEAMQPPLTLQNSTFTSRKSYTCRLSTRYSSQRSRVSGHVTKRTSEERPFVFTDCNGVRILFRHDQPPLYQSPQKNTTDLSFIRD
jgi:hypothetical protein